LLVTIAAGLGGVQYKAGKDGTGALVLAVLIAVGFVGIQATASKQARQAVERYLHGKDPASRVLDASMTSFPANPLCWMFVSVESNEESDSYRLQRGLVSLAPALIPVAACPPGLSGQAMLQHATPALAVLSQHEGSLSALRTLSDENCHFNAWLRFARAPLLADGYASDLRFMSASRGNFTTLHLGELKDRACSPHVPQWGFPRADMLTAPEKSKNSSATE
jgi:inner membrane protein